MFDLICVETKIITQYYNLTLAVNEVQAMYIAISPLSFFESRSLFQSAQVPIVAVLAIVGFYAVYPQFWAGVPRMAATMYVGTAILFVLLLLLYRGGQLLQGLFSGSGGPVGRSA